MSDKRMVPVFPNPSPDLVEPVHELSRQVRAVQNLSAVVASRLPGALRRFGADEGDDGYPGGGGGGRSGGVADPVGSVALRRAGPRHPAALESDLGDQLFVALTALRLANKILDRVLGVSMSETELRRSMCASCSGRVADPDRRDGRCITCGREDDERRRREADERRARRYRQEDGT